MSRKHSKGRVLYQIVMLLLTGLFFLPALCAAEQIEITVNANLSDSLSGVRVYGFTESGAYTGKSATTDENGTATFDPADFTAGNYQFRADYLGRQFWSDPVALPGQSLLTIFIQEASVAVKVTDGANPMEAVRVYLFSASGAYLNRNGDTDATGEVTFYLPVEMKVKFRADILGYQFWSDEIPVQFDTEVDLLIEHRDIEITVEGLFQEITEPIEGVKVYLFKPPGSYLGQNLTTDLNGQVTFSLPEGAYKVRADYLGQQFWSEEFTWQNRTICVPLADVEVRVTGNGQTLEGVRVYAFTENGSYLGISYTTGSGGRASFRLPAGDYKFRADYQGGQYWAETTLLAHQINSVEISMGGGSFTFNVFKTETDPLTGVNCYVFGESGTYLGLNAQTDEDGQVVFDLSDGVYKIRVDYLGYQFWGNLFETPETLSQTLQINHTQINLTVEGLFQETAQALEGVKAYLFTPEGSYQGQNRITDENGTVAFDLPERAYKVRADYLGRQFWSEEFTWQHTTVSVPLAHAVVTVTGNGQTLEGVLVYVFTEAGSYLGISDKTDSNGQVLFMLPAGNYRFRADYQGGQYWAEKSLLADQLNPVDLSTGGGSFTFTVLKEAADPLVGVNCYVFSESGSYLGIYGTTDENGQITFELSEGNYKIRIDYLGYQYWSDIYEVPSIFSDTYIIAHQEVIVAVEGLYGTVAPLEGLNVYLFTISGTYLGQYQVTDAEGKIILTLPDQRYKVRVDYLGRQFWSDDFQSMNSTITIYEGELEVHVHRAGVNLEGTRVYLFSQDGAYLGKYETTDSLGIARFILPDRSFKFRVDEGGNQYWSQVVEITAGVINSLEIDLSPTTVSINAGTETILVGGSSTLTWHSTNAYACEIEPGIGSVDLTGSIDVSPAETTLFIVTATGPGGTATDAVQVLVTSEFTLPDDLGHGLAFDEQEGGGGLMGETVRLLNGNTVERRSDLSFPSPNSLGLSFATTYNSRSSRMGSPGYGWTHTYEVSLDPDFEIGGSSYLKVLGPTGRAYYFHQETDGVYKGAFHERSYVKAETEEFVWHRLNGTRYGFSSEGKLAWIDDEKGNRLELGYDQNSRLDRVTDTAGNRSLTFNYNGAGLLESISGPVTSAVSDGIWVTYGYDLNQNLISVTYADGSGFNYNYGDLQDLHNLTEKRNKASHLLNTWTYDSLDRCVNHFSSRGKGLSVNYVDDTQINVTDAYGTMRTYNLTEIDGRVRVATMEGITLPPYSDSIASRWEYDESVRLIEVEYGRVIVSEEYGESGSGRTNQYQGHDDRGNPSTVRLAVGTPEEQVITFTYHPDMNRMLSRSEASVLGSGDKVTIWDYDNDYDSIPNESPTGLLSRIVERGYTKDASGVTVPYEYVTIFAYNAKGQVLSIDGPLPGTDDTTVFSYDTATGDVLSVTRPLVGTSGFTDYDAAGRVGRITDANGQSRSFTYDGKGRINVITHDGDGSTRTVTYNAAGFTDTTIDEDGVNRSYEYDAVYGRLSQIVDHDGNYTAYAYDAQGNKTEMGKYDAAGTRTSHKLWSYDHPDFPGRLWREVDADESFTEYRYDDSGNMSAITQCEYDYGDEYEGEITAYGYDPLNRLTAVTQPGNIVTTFSYDGSGNLAALIDAEGHATTFTNDDRGRLVSSTSPDTGAVNYVYDAGGNLLQKTDARA